MSRFGVYRQPVVIVLVWLLAFADLQVLVQLEFPVPWPLPEVVYGLGLVVLLVLLLTVPVMPMRVHTSVDIGIPPEVVFDRLSDPHWGAAHNPSLRRLEVTYTLAGGELRSSSWRIVLRNWLSLRATLLEAHRPDRWVVRATGSGTDSVIVRSLEPTEAGSRLTVDMKMRVAVFLWATEPLRPRKLRDTYPAEVRRLLSELEAEA